MSSRKTVSVGIIGPGFWTETMYLPVLNNHPRGNGHGYLWSRRRPNPSLR